MFLTPSVGVDLLLLAIVTLFFVHMRIEKKRNRWMWIDPLNGFWAGVLILFVMQPILYYEALNSAYGEPIMLETLGWILFGLVWLLVGYHWKLGVAVGNKLPNMPARMDPTLIGTAGVVMVGLGFVGYFYIWQVSGGVKAWLSVGRGGTDIQATIGYIAVMEHFLPAGVTLLLLRAELFPTTIIPRVMIWSMGMLQWMWFVYLGSRARTIFFLLTIGAVYYLPRRKNPHWLLLTISTVFLFFLASFLAHYRGQFTNLSLNLDQLNPEEVSRTIAPAKFGGNVGQDNGKPLGDLEFNCVEAVVELVPHTFDYNYGYTMLEVVTKAVPRFLWPDKIYPLYEASSPIMETRKLSGYWLTTNNSRFLVGPTFTYMGYWYHAGGAIGLVLGGLFTGSMLRAIRCYYDRDPHNTGNLVLYILLLSVGFQEVASTPFNWLYTTPLVVIPVVALMFIARSRTAQGFEVVPALAAGG